MRIIMCISINFCGEQINKLKLIQGVPSMLIYKVNLKKGRMLYPYCFEIQTKS